MLLSGIRGCVLARLKADNHINTFTRTDFISKGLQLQVLPLILSQSRDDIYPAFFH